MLEGLASILMLLGVGVPGWLVLERLRVPAAPLIGPMITVALLGSFGFNLIPPPDLARPGLQIAVGLFIGARVTPRIIGKLRYMAVPALVVCAWWLMTSLALGFALYRLTDLDVLTAFLGSAAGGVAEMSLLAVSLDADPGKVAVMQFFRIAMTFVLVPLVSPWLFRGSAAWRPVAAGSDRAQVGSDGNPHPEARPSLAGARTVALAATGGLALHIAGFPAGGLVGAMLAVGVASALGYKSPPFPEWVRAVARLGLGGLIGMTFTGDTLASLVGLAVPVAVLSAVMLANGFALALLLRRMTGWNTETCVLSTSAGGLTQMSLIAEDLGADPVVVTLLHLVRLMMIILVMPPLLVLLLM